MIFETRKKELDQIMTESHIKIINAIHANDLDVLDAERNKYSPAYDEYCGMLLSQTMEMSDDIAALNGGII